MADQSEQKKLTMKLLIDKRSQKVLFAEAGKEVVDFLFSFLTLPIGTVIKLLDSSDTEMVGCAGKLYDSIRGLDSSYLHNNRDKDRLLLDLAGSQAQHFLANHPTAPRSYYRCQERTNPYSANQPSTCNFKYVSDGAGTRCPTCNVTMTKEMVFVGGENGGEGVWGGGIVKGAVTYMVMDDLSVSPLSMIFAVSVLNGANVSISCLEERTVDMGMDECLLLLKASLQSKTALTDMFRATKEKIVVQSGTQVEFEEKESCWTRALNPSLFV